MAHLRRQAVSRRATDRGPVGAAVGTMLLGSGTWSDEAVAAAVTLHRDGRSPHGFLVNGRHLSFGDDPRRGDVGRRPAFQLCHTYNAVSPRSVRVWLEYGRDRSYGHVIEAEIRELDQPRPRLGRPAGPAGRPPARERGPVLRARPPDRPVPRHRVPLPASRYSIKPSSALGATPDATFMTAPGEVTEPFTLHGVRRRGDPGADPRPGPVAAARIDVGHVEQRLVRRQRSWTTRPTPRSTRPSAVRSGRSPQVP